MPLFVAPVSEGFRLERRRVGLARRPHWNIFCLACGDGRRELKTQASASAWARGHVGSCPGAPVQGPENVAEVPW